MLLGAAPGGRLAGSIARVLAGAGREREDRARGRGPRGGWRRGARRRRLEPGRRGRRALQGARLRRLGHHATRPISTSSGSSFTRRSAPFRALGTRRRARVASRSRAVAARGHRAARAGGLHPRRRQGGPQGCIRAAHPGRPRLRGRDRLDASLRAFAALGLCLRPGHADHRAGRRDPGARLGASPSRQGRTGHRCVARNRRLDRRRALARRRPCRRASTCLPSRSDLEDGRGADRRLGDRARHHRGRCSGADRRPPCLRARGRRRRRPQRRRHARQDARPHGRGDLGSARWTSTSPRRSGSTTGCSSAT